MLLFDSSSHVGDSPPKREKILRLEIHQLGDIGCRGGSQPAENPNRKVGRVSQGVTLLILDDDITLPSVCRRRSRSENSVDDFDVVAVNRHAQLLVKPRLVSDTEPILVESRPKKVFGRITILVDLNEVLSNRVDGDNSGICEHVILQY